MSSAKSCFILRGWECHCHVGPGIRSRRVGIINLCSLKKIELFLRKEVALHKCTLSSPNGILCLDELKLSKDYSHSFSLPPCTPKEATIREHHLKIALLYIHPKVTANVRGTCKEAKLPLGLTKLTKHRILIVFPIFNFL